MSEEEQADKESTSTLLSTSSIGSFKSRDTDTPLMKCQRALAPTKIVTAQLADIYPNHVSELTPSTYSARFVNPFWIVSFFVGCAITAVVVLCGPIAKVVSFKGLQFTIPSMIASLCSMSIKLYLSIKLLPLTKVYFLSRVYDTMVLLLMPCLFIITCTPYDYITNPQTVSRERNSAHNHNGREVLNYKFTFIPIWVLMAVLVLLRFVRLNMSMVYERRNFKNRNCSTLVLRGRRYPKLGPVTESEILDWFEHLDKYMSRFGTLILLETIAFGVSFIALMSSFLLDGFLGPIDTCLAFTSVLLFLPSVYFITEFVRTNKEVSEEYSFHYVGDDNVYSVSFGEIKVLLGLMITMVGAILNIRV